MEFDGGAYLSKDPIDPKTIDDPVESLDHRHQSLEASLTFQRAVEDEAGEAIPEIGDYCVVPVRAISQKDEPILNALPDVTERSVQQQLLLREIFEESTASSTLKIRIKELEHRSRSLQQRGFIEPRIEDLKEREYIKAQLEDLKEGLRKSVRRKAALRKSLRTVSLHEDQAPASFRHSEDFRSITLRGQTYALTSQIAQIIQYLFDQSKNGPPDVSSVAVLEYIGSGKRLRDCFPGPYRRLWKALITSKKKGTVRLNL